MDMEIHRSTEEKYNATATKQTHCNPSMDILPAQKSGKRSILIDFTERTTFHGLRYIVEEGCILRRFMWLVVTMSCFFAVGYQIYERVTFYGSWPVNVNVEINYNKTLKFPAVTICNQNSFKATKAAEFGLYYLIEDVFSKSAMFPLEDIQRYNASNMPIDDLFVNLGHDKHDLVVSCRWKNKECGPDDFVPVLSDHGLCYTFSPNSTEMVISAPGTDSGLQLMLNIEQYEYMNGPHDSAGVKVLLHDPEHTPLVASLGQAVSTGFSAFAGINLLSIEYQLPPYGDCGSKRLNHTTLYTAEECFLDCMTAVVTEKCGCRDMNMKMNGSSGPAICNLLLYFSCLKAAKDEFYGMFEHRCKCPVSCEVTIYDPTFSYGSLSNHAVDSLLTSNLSTSLYWKLLKASEIKTKMDKRKQGELRSLFEPLNETNTNFIDALHAMPVYIDKQLEILEEIANYYTDVFGYQVWMRVSQSKIFSIGVLQDMDSVSNYLSESTNEFLHIWLQRFESLIDTTDRQNSNRDTIYNQTIHDLQFRKFLIRKAEDDVISLFHSFTERALIHDIWFLDLNKSISKYFLPWNVEAALSYEAEEGPVSDMLEYCKNETVNLYRNVSSVVDELIALSESAFLKPGNETLHPESEQMTTKYMNASFKSKTCRDILDKMVFRKPILKLEWEEEFIRKEYVELNRVRTQLSRTLYKLKEIINQSLLDMNSTFKSFIDLTSLFVNAKQHSIVDVYSAFASENIQSVISNLKDFSSEVDTRQQAIQGYFVDILGIYSIEWSGGHTKLLDTYNNLYDMKLSRPNTSEYFEPFHDRINYARHDLDVRQQLGHIAHDLIHAIDSLAQYLDNFNKSVSINSVFLKDNFLKLNIFYRQLSYEYIQQQKGYDIFALICDIGGSLGLFIGASMLTVVEVIDLLLGQTPVFRKKTTFKQKPSHTNDTSDYICNR